MARRSPKRKKAGPETNSVLIIFLVFFILTTIGGFLFAFLDKQDTKKLADTIELQKSQISEKEDKVKFYQYQALLYRRDILGQTLNDADNKELIKLEPKFKDGTEWASDAVDRKSVNDVVAEAQKFLKQQVPAADGVKNFKDALEQMARLVDAAKKDIAPHLVAKDEGDKRADTAKAELDIVKTKYKEQSEADAKKHADDKQSLLDQRAKVEVQLKELTDTLKAEANKTAQVEIKKKAEIDTRDKEIDGLKKRIETLDAQLALAKPSLKDIETPDLQVRGVGRVVNRRGDLVQINLGLAQKMTPQMTFSIHAVGGDGLPLPTSKGSVEVLSVFDAGSEGRIMIERSKSDPIQQGDVLVNPNWNPDRKRHVAITGVADLSGEGRSQMREFRQLLERQNTIIDAFLEQKDTDWEITGKGITRETNYLILGEDLPDNKDQAVAADNLRKKNAKMVEQARQNGVFVVSLRNYLDMIGYQPPRGLGDSTGYRAGLTAQPERKDPVPMVPMVPMKEMEAKPK